MSRLGTPYQSEVHIDDDYTAGVGDDVLIATSIAGGKTLTLPDPRTCVGDNGDKIVANLATSGGTLTLAAAAGAIVGASSLLVGEATRVQSNGIDAWVANNKFSAEGLTSSAISTADSKGVSSGTRASVADSKAVSGASGGTGLSTATSKADSASTRASVADSKAVSDSLVTSVADSKGVSGGTRASVADSKAVSDSVLTSTADSKGVSAGAVASNADSRLTSAGL